MLSQYVLDRMLMTSGLDASWVTHSLIASTRPSDRLIEKYEMLDQFERVGVTSIFNLQQAGEHADCGDGNVDGKWSYSPAKVIHPKEGGVDDLNNATSSPV